MADLLPTQYTPPRSRHCISNRLLKPLALKHTELGARIVWRMIALASVAITSFSSICAAVGFADAEAALRRGDYPSAIPIYQSLSDAGDSHAMVRLGALFQKGEGVPRDLSRAVALYTQAAFLGNADAQYSLGNLYLIGEGVPQDDDWAFTYYRQAADQGHVLARKNVDEFYRAAGVAPPAPNVPPDVANVPSTKPSAEGTGTAGDAEYNRIVPAEFSADELKAIDLARARGIAVDVQASGGTLSVQTSSTAVISASGPTLESVQQNIADGATAQASADLEILASQGNAEAQYLLSELLLTLDASADEQGEALLWLKRSAAAGYADAQYKLAGYYLRGESVPPDEAEAVTWYRAAARQGHADAREKLDSIYRDAGLVPP